MAEAQIVIEFDGGDAASHSIDMRLYGKSLQGMERIISDGIIVILARRLPKRKERAPLIVKAQESRIGSHSTPAIIAENAHLLQLGWSIITTKGDEIILNWVSFVLKYLGGDKKGAEKHLDALMESLKMHLGALESAGERSHAENAEWRALIYKLVDRLAPAGAQAVAPIGPSVRSMSFQAGPSGALAVDEPMADVIRSKGELEVESDMISMQLRTDGFATHSRKLLVENPELAGSYIHADIQDPVFYESRPNAYTEAASRGATIMVKAKRGYHAGKLKKIYIMDFEGVID